MATVGRNSSKRLKTENSFYSFSVFDSPSCSESEFIGTVEFLNGTNLFDYARFICDNILERTRSEKQGGNGVTEHLWDLKFGKQSGRKLVWDRTVYRCGPLLPESYNGAHELVASDFCLGDLKLSPLTLCRFSYDYGNNTKVFLRLDSVGVPTNIILPRFSPAARNFSNSTAISVEEGKQLLESVPAFHVPESQKLDAIFPHLSRAIMSPRNISVSFGMNTKFSREDDGQFFVIEEEIQDVMRANAAFEDIDEFMMLAEKACQPNGQYSSFIIRFLSPSKLSDNAEMFLADFMESQKEQKKTIFGSEYRCFRYTPAELEAAKEEKRTQDAYIPFSELFPLTTEQLGNGKFRWLSFKNGVLYVCVGRGAGKYCREVVHSNVCQEWPANTFSTFHELMCAVEASWTVPGNSSVKLGNLELEVDQDVGPSKPVPPPLKVLGNATSSKELLSPSSEKMGNRDEGPYARSQVISLAFSDDPSGEETPEGFFLFSGHGDGTLRKWNLRTHKMIWEKHLAKKAAAEGDLSVMGLLVSSDKKSIFCWFRSHIILSISCEQGRVIRSFQCDIENQDDFYPFVNTVCFAKVDEVQLDVLLVGLHCVGNALEDYSNDFDEEEMGEGNIVPFLLDTGLRLPTWRGHIHPVTAMAIIPDKYAVSIATSSDVEDMILWDLVKPGTVLRRFALNKLSFRLVRNRPDRKLVSITEVQGLHPYGNNTLLVMCDWGDKIVVFNIPTLELKGYVHVGLKAEGYEDAGFVAHMVGHGSTLLASNQDSEASYVFDVPSILSPAFDLYPGPDPELMAEMITRGGEVSEQETPIQSEDFSLNECPDVDNMDSDEEELIFKHRSFAQGQIRCPLMPSRSENEYDFYGTDVGGPSTIAVNRNDILAAGYRNGSIQLVKLKEFEANLDGNQGFFESGKGHSSCLAQNMHDIDPRPVMKIP